jgi:hypothetical protein
MKNNETGRSRGKYGRLNRYVQGLAGRSDGRSHLQDLDVDGTIIFKWMFKKWDGVSRTGLIWLRIRTSGGLL